MLADSTGANFANAIYISLANILIDSDKLFGLWLLEVDPVPPGLLPALPCFPVSCRRSG